MQDGAGDIYFLEDVGFDTFARDQDEMLVMFYSNSCGACSRIKPFYEEVATLMTEERPELTLAAVDLSKARELGDRYEGTGNRAVRAVVQGSASNPSLWPIVTMT